MDSEGNQLGVMPTREALRIAQDRQLDLVTVAPNAKPPVCRIMDYGKYKYEQAKREKEAKKKQKTINIKEVRLSPNIDDHDLQTKLKNVRRFLGEGDKVKVTIRFRGRQITHADRGREIMTEMAKQVSDLGAMEKHPKVEGRHMNMVLAPKDKKQEQGEKGEKSEKKQKSQSAADDSAPAGQETS